MDIDKNDLGSKIAARLPSPRVLAIVAACVVALAALAGAGWWWMAAQQQRGLTVYAEALNQVEAAESPNGNPEAKATAIAGLELALQRYPSSSAAPRAAYELGNAKYAARQYAAARGAYGIAAARSRSSTVQALSRAGIGYTWEAERDFSKAIDAYQAALARLKPADFYYEQLLLDLARAQELAGRKDAAAETYKRFVRDVPKSRRVEDVKSRLAALGVSS